MEFDQSESVRARRQRELPTFYYHSHFVELLEFVRTHYGHVLREQDVRFVEAFNALDQDAQCLYVRLVNRKGRVYAVNKLRYPELGPIGPLIDVLRSAGLVGSPSPDDIGDILVFLTKDELHRLLAQTLSGVSRSMRKPELVEIARQHVVPERFIDEIGDGRLVVQKRTDEVRYLCFLFFGRIQDGLSQFTMRDLGLVRVHDFRDTYEPRFAEREQALEHYFFAGRLAAASDPKGERLSQLLREAPEWPEPEFGGAARLRDKLACRLGRELERSGAPEHALSLYAKGESLRCTERQVRILLELGKRKKARRLLERCLETPRSEEEWLFARDLYEQKFENKRTSLRTDTLRESETIDIDESRSGSPERAVVDYFEAQGKRAFRVENAIWRTLFGLLFWDVLFESDDATLHSPFDFLPAALADRSFYVDNADRVEARLAMLDEPSEARRHVLKVSTRNYGRHNGVFRWRRSTLDAMFALLDVADGASLRRILRRFCKDYKGSRYGYPDLLVIDDEGPRFVEVKAEGDVLRAKQLLRIEQLRAAGFHADVLRVRWVLDPSQAYVVVDVETTGGRGEQHRITEIGAVKVRNGRIEDRFSTLINPQRAIPAGITKLTGITAEMVAEAPYFSDVADELEQFLDGAIFVAHNVDFDYGFVAREYQRLGRQFRYPKLCTCASMRRLYPGHASYSLGALCEQYQIPLRNHHRALCDAEAAAELLLLINDKRRQ